MNVPESVAQSIKLTKAQSRRLRHYFSHRKANCLMDGIDLDLIGLKFIKTETNNWGSYAEVTELGIQVLHQHRQADIAARSVHHDLGGRLAEFLRKQGRITWENIEFRNWLETKTHPKSGACIDYPHWQCVRPDVYSILPSLNLKGANPCVHEVKVSRADFLCDLAKPEKREAYSAMSEAVYYVAPDGMIDPSEMPQGYGLLVERKEGEFALLKRPRKRKVELQPQHYLNMIVKPGVYPDNYGI